MNAEEWKKYRNERWAKKKEIPQATKATKNTEPQPHATKIPQATKIKKGNTAQNVAKKNIFTKSPNRQNRLRNRRQGQT